MQSIIVETILTPPPPPPLSSLPPPPPPPPPMSPLAVGPTRKVINKQIKKIEMT